jgi:pentatricopeptide repeat protein
MTFVCSEGSNKIRFHPTNHFVSDLHSSLTILIQSDLLTISQFSRVKQEQEAPQIKEEVLAVKRELKPDHGENFVPGSEAAPTGAAPQALDHFKRGYKERAYLRERETQELSVDFEASAPVKSEDDAVEGEAASADNVQPQLPEKQPESYRFQPPVQIQQPPQRQRGPPPQHPSGSGYRGTYRGPSSFDAVRVIDILCQPGCNIFEVLDQAQFDFSNNFQSGKALTAILSNLARRRKLGIALTVWQWMDQRRIEKNVFHYNSLISVCEKVKDNQRALHLLEEMDRKGIEKNEVT